MCPDTHKEENKQAKMILQELDDTILKDFWTKTNFLKAIGKELSQIRESLIGFIKAREAEEEALTNNTTKRAIQKNHQQEIFISVYSSEGKNIQSWERILTNLPRQMISRPIYATEEDVQAWIKHKENKLNEGYVSIFVNIVDLLEVAEDKKPKDKFGKPLLILKDRSVTLDNIQRFVHVSGDYVYSHGRLQKFNPI